MGSCTSKVQVLAAPEERRHRSDSFPCGAASADRAKLPFPPTAASPCAQPSSVAHDGCPAESSSSCRSSISSTWSADCSSPEAPTFPGPECCNAQREDVAALLSEVQLGPVIGCWGAALLYRATWCQRSVAVMVTDHLAEDEEGAALLESSLKRITCSPQLEHPNLVKVLHCAVRRPVLPDGELEELESWQPPCSGPLCYDEEYEGGYEEDVPCWDVNDGQPRRKHLQVWVISELCGQGTLETAIARGWLREGSSALGKAGAQPNLQAILATAHEIASALHHLHGLGLVHKRLNGTAVLLSPASGERPFTAKLSSACHLACQQAQPLAHQTMRLDMAAHTAPEVLLRCDQGQTPAANVYSYGVLLHEMFSGQLAWESLSSSALMRAVLAGRPLLSQLDHCPAAYQWLVSACTSPDPALRPSLPSILALLERMAADLPAPSAAEEP